MEQIILEDLIKAVNGELLSKDVNLKTVIKGASSDNRKVTEGDVFFAFVGENMDGHRFVDAAIEAGACGAIVSKIPEKMEDNAFYIKVEDTIKAAGDLAKWYRSKFNIPVIGVTGSVGKTTMKDMIASVLSQKFNVLKTAANFNNNIGLPRTLLGITKETQVCVVEMGMNHMGEIDYLVDIAKPTCAVITNVGDAHIGNLGSRENIFKAKSEIFNGLKEKSLAVMNADDEYLKKLRNDKVKNEKFRFVWVGESNGDIIAKNIEDSLKECVKFLLVEDKEELLVTVPALGRHMIYPAMTAYAIGKDLGMTDEEIIKGIAAYVPTAMRMEAWNVGDNITIYNDTYNANPQSMKAGLTTLSKAITSVKVAVLGDMLELGDMEENLHREVGSFAAGLNLTTLVTVGKRAEYIAAAAKECGMSDVVSFEDTESAIVFLESLVKKDTTLYFKASHAMALEKLAVFCKEIAEKNK